MDVSWTVNEQSGRHYHQHHQVARQQVDDLTVDDVVSTTLLIFTLSHPFHCLVPQCFPLMKVIVVFKRGPKTTG